LGGNFGEKVSSERGIVKRNSQFKARYCRGGENRQIIANRRRRVHSSFGTWVLFYTSRKTKMKRMFLGFQKDGMGRKLLLSFNGVSAR